MAPQTKKTFKTKKRLELDLEDRLVAGVKSEYQALPIPANAQGKLSRSIANSKVYLPEATDLPLCATYPERISSRILLLHTTLQRALEVTAPNNSSIRSTSENHEDSENEERRKQ